MNKIEKLLQELCPNGVQWKALGEISEIYGGLTWKNKSDFENGNAKYISYKNIFNNIEVDLKKLEIVKVDDSENQYKVKYGDILFTGSSETADEAGMSSAITTKIYEDIYLNSFSFGLRFNENIEMAPEFAKYLFRSHFMRTEISKSANGVTRYNVSKKGFSKIQIPIPPLTVQEEIVKVLDNFTELTAELTTELTARKKQYTYYRDKLLNFAPQNSDKRDFTVEWKTLGEVANYEQPTSYLVQSTNYNDDFKTPVLTCWKNFNSWVYR